MATLKERFNNINVKEELNKAKTTIEAKIKNIDINEGINKAKVQVNKLNDFALKTTEGTLDTIFVNGEKWNGVASKAVDTGLKLSEKQLDLFFNTLEAVKGQVVSGADRFKNVFKKGE